MVCEAAGFEGAMTRGQRIYVAAAIFCCLMPFACPVALPAEPKHVMLLHSFGRDFKPWSEYAKDIRLELDQQSPWPLDITEHPLIFARSPDEDSEIAFVEYSEHFLPSATPI